MFKGVQLACIACLLLNTSCMMDSKDNKPSMIIPNEWPHQDHFAMNDASHLVNISWWKQFNNHELNQLIETGLHQNNDINVSIEKINYTQSQLDEIRLNWLPGMSVLAGQSQFPVLGNPGGFFIAAPAYILNIVQQYHQEKSAKARLKASYFARYSVNIAITAQLSATFFKLIAQQEYKRIYQRLLKHERMLLELERSKYYSGLISPDEIEQLNSQIQQTKAQIDRINHTITQYINNLHYLLNENPGEMSIKTSFKQFDTTPIIPGNLPVTVLNQRPDVREAEALLKEANANIAAIKATLLPSVSLDAYLGKGSTIQGSINLTENYISAPVIDLPVFAQINASKARAKIAGLNYIKTVRRALRDVDNDLSNFYSSSQQLNRSVVALNAEQKHCHWVNIRFKHGISDHLEGVKCDILLDKWMLLINNYKLKKVLVLVKLYQDLGGGYLGT